MELWSSSVSTSSPSSLCTSTSEYSEDTLPSYAELLDYSPAIVEQPQPTDSTLVPKECMFDIKLRCPPDVEIIRIPVLEQAICSLQDLLSPNIECRATTRPPRPSSTAECLRLIARLREEQASAASWEPQAPFEVAEMD